MRFAILLIALSSVLELSCKRRETPSLEVKPKTQQYGRTQDDLSKMQKERDDLITQLKDQQVAEAGRLAELTLERDKFSAEKDSLDDQVSNLKKELELSKDLSPNQKQELQNKLDETLKSQSELVEKLSSNSTEMQKAMDKISSLNKNIAALNLRIGELNKQIEELRNELSVERAKKQDQGTGNPPPVITPPEPTPSPTPAPPITSDTGTLSAQTWQVYQRNADATESCFEFASTTAKAPLISTKCVPAPVPIRQQFKTESFASGALIIDQRSKMCVGLDSTMSPLTTARVFLASCSHPPDKNQLFEIKASGAGTDTILIKSISTEKCLVLADDTNLGSKVIQGDCASASYLRLKVIGS